MKSIVGKWEGISEVYYQPVFHMVYFPTIVILEDGSLIVRSSSIFREFGPYLYKGRLQNGKFRTPGNDYTLYERDGRRVLVPCCNPFVNTCYEYKDNSTTLPSKKIFLKDWDY
jgi:hypothetical protein